MSARPREITEVHTRIMKCALEVEESRAYWAHAGEAATATAQHAFDNYWFGARSLARVEVLLHNMRARFAAYPNALAVLGRWTGMSPDTRTVICHWHLQLSDPLYRKFTGEYLVQRRMGLRTEVTRDLIVSWVVANGLPGWTMATRIQFASKMLSSAYVAGLVKSNRDPRPLGYPRVPDEALGYLMYLLREIDFEGSLLDNPFTRSVGLEGAVLEDRLRSLRSITFRRQSDLIDVSWEHEGLRAWAEASLRADPWTASSSEP